MRMPMKSALRFIPVILLLAGLAAGWLYLYMHSHAVSVDQQNATLGRLRDLKQMDSDWSADVLKSQAEITKNYDELVKPLRPFADILGMLDIETKRLSDSDLQTETEAIKQAIDNK